MSKKTTDQVSLKRISELVDVPLTTLQGWRDRFNEYMPSSKAEGKRWKVYDNQAIEVARTIKRMVAKDKATHEIREELSKLFTPIYEANNETNNDNTESTTTQQLRNDNDKKSPSQQRGLQVVGEGMFEAFSFNKSLMIQVRHQRELLKIKDETMMELQQKVSDLSTELEETKTELNNERSNHNETKQKLAKARKTPWIIIGGKQ